MNSEDFSTKDLDHLGIVAGICDKIQLTQIIDDCIDSTNRNLSVGEATKSMLLNALGFSSRPLYLTPEFFQNKPVELLIRENINSSHLNEHSLGRALDALYNYGTSELFAIVASKALKSFGIQFKGSHLDSTTFSFQGEFDCCEKISPDENQEEEAKSINITYGYSKDKRDDLKQAVFSMICAHESTLPIWIEALSGNASDKTSFPKTIRLYLEQLEKSEANEMFFVFDSAGYSEKNLEALTGINWISRVPETIGEAKDLIQTVHLDKRNKKLGEHYLIKEVDSNYGNLNQRWLLVHSEKAFERENKSFEKKLEVKRIQYEKALKKLSNKEFETKKKAKEALEKCSEKWKYFDATLLEFKEKPHYKSAGRPRLEEKAEKVKYQILAKLEKLEEAIEDERKKLGKFIVATNISKKEMKTEEVLENYKKQASTVERGFRFLKDPMFFASSLFLKKPERIMSLLMIMGLSLLVYSLAEHQLRERLVKENKTLPNQKGKETQRITMRRVFQIFEGIRILVFEKVDSLKRLVLNVKPIHHRILDLFDKEIQKYYFFDT